MNDLPPEEKEPQIPDPSTTAIYHDRDRIQPESKDSKSGQFAAGCVSYFVVMGLVYLLALGLKQNGGGNLLITAIFGAPVLGLVLLLIPKTRKFGLGWFIAVVVSWFLLIGTCFFILKYHFINN